MPPLPLPLPLPPLSWLTWLGWLPLLRRCRLAESELECRPRAGPPAANGSDVAAAAAAEGARGIIIIMLDQHGYDWPRADAKTPGAWPSRSPALPLSRPTTNARRSILLQPASEESATTPTHVSHCDATDLAHMVRLSPVVNNRECFKINDTFTMPDERPTFALASARVNLGHQTDRLSRSCIQTSSALQCSKGVESQRRGSSRVRLSQRRC